MTKGGGSGGTEEEEHQGIMKVEAEKDISSCYLESRSSVL